MDLMTLSDSLIIGAFSPVTLAFRLFVDFAALTFFLG